MLAKKRAKYAVSPFDEVTGEPVPFLDSELDHYGLTFEEIAEAWASKQESIPLAGGDNDIGLKMLPEQEADWVAYHAVHATVRLVSSATHKRITAQGVRRGT